MIKPFGKHRTSVRARRNNDVSSNNGAVSRAAVRYRSRKKKRMFTVVTVAVAAVMVPIMIASAANGDMNMSAQQTPAAQVEAVDSVQEPMPTSTPELTEKTLAGTPQADNSSVTAEGEVTPSAANTEIQDAKQETPVAEQTPTYKMLAEGMTDPDVSKIQQRLMDLYYMGRDETTDYFGPQTNQALKYFQRKHGLSVDGAAGPETQAVLFSDQAKEYTVSLGADGPDVERIQERLMQLGYSVSSASGYFGEETQKAVQYFQRMSGLTDDGNVGKMTEEALFAGGAQKSLEEVDREEKAKEEAAAKKAQEEAAKTEEKKEESKNNSSEEKKEEKAEEKKEESKNNSSEEKQEESAPAPKEESSGSNDGGGSAPSYTADAGSVEAFISVAQAQLGKPYVLGGKGPNSFDCSGLIYYALRESGNDVGYMTSSGWRNSGFQTISRVEDMERGDIICMNGHVAIYLGGGRVLDASSSQNAMVERDFGSWFQNGFILAKRPL